MGGGSLRLLLIRHPETAANAEARYASFARSPYTVRGRRQQTALVEAVAAWGPSFVHASPQERALRPALETAARLEVPVAVDEGLAEYDVGDAEGHTHEEAVARGFVSEVPTHPEPAERPFTGGESMGEFFARTQGALERVLRRGAGRVAVFTHGGTLCTLLVALMKLPPEAMWLFDVKTASGAELAVRDGTAVLAGFGPLPGCGAGETMHGNP